MRAAGVQRTDRPASADPRPRFSLLKGGHGFSGISANFFPQLLAWLAELQH